MDTDEKKTNVAVINMVEGRGRTLRKPEEKVFFLRHLRVLRAKPA
jgi:hypothetical protein